MKNPKISIITITYNSEKTLRRTIESVKSQGYDNLEYIIVDGGSSDATLSIVAEYGSFISKIVSEPDEGISDAFNKGIFLATGGIIGIINSDDGLEKDALKMLAASYSPEVDIYRGKVVLWNEETDSKIIASPSMTFGYRNIVQICHQSTFVSLEAYKKYGVFDKKCRYMMDFDFLLRCYKAGAVFREIEDVLAFNSLGGLTATRYTKDRQKELEYVLYKNGAKRSDIVYRNIIGKTKRFIKRILGKDVSVKIRNSLLKKMN